MKKIIISALFAPLTALAQTYPSPTFNSITLQNPLTPSNGGTGVSNSGTITLGGNFTTAGGSPLVLNTTGATNITLPTSGTLLNNSSGATAGANSNITSLSGLTTPLSVSQGGTGSTTATGSGSAVLATSPTLVTPNLGTPAAATLTNATGLPVSTGISGLGAGVATALGNAVTGSGAPVLATSPALSNPSVGTQAVGTNSSLAASTGFVAAHQACPSIMDYGGNRTGAADNSAAFSATVSASQAVGGGNTCVSFPPGTFLFSSNVAVTISTTSGTVIIQGAGSESTFFKSSVSSGAALTVNYKDDSSSVHIRDMSFLTTQAGTAQGINLVMTATSATLGPNAAPLSDITNVTFRGSDGWSAANFWQIGVHNTGTSNLNFFNDTFMGPTPTPTGYGIYLDYATDHSIIPIVFNLYGCNFVHLFTGLLYGGNTQGVSVASSNMTANFYGILVPSSGSAPDQLSVTGSQMNNINASIATQITLQSFTAANNFFLVENNSTAISLVSTGQFSITANVFAPNTLPATSQTAITIGTYNQGAGVITANQFDLLTTGILLGTGSAHVNIQSNAYAPGIGATVSGSGSCSACTIGGGSQ